MFIGKDNFYYNYENISLLKSKIGSTKDGNFIYFNTSEATFYYYLLSGFINTNFIYSFSSPKTKELRNNISYIIKDIPFDLNINNNSNIKFFNGNENLYIIFFSKKEQNILINNNSYEINKGENIVKTNDKYLLFNNIEAPIRIIGIKNSISQKNYWPWKENIEFKFRQSTYMPYSYSFDTGSTTNVNFQNTFEKIKADNYQRTWREIVDTKIFDNCEQEVVSDKDKSIILKLNCS